jgi:hypothetical protein
LGRQAEGPFFQLPFNSLGKQDYMVNAVLSALIGTWQCAPRTPHLNSFTLTVSHVNQDRVSMQGINYFPSNGRNQWHTLTVGPDGTYTIDQDLVPYPYTGRLGQNGKIDFARANQDRLFFQLLPDRETLRFVRYKTTDLEIYREQHMVVCQRA